MAGKKKVTKKTTAKKKTVAKGSAKVGADAQAREVADKAAKKELTTVIVDGVERLCLTTEHLLELELTHAKKEANREGTAARLIKADKIEAEGIMKARSLRVDAQRMKDERHELDDDHKRLINKLNDFYGIDFAHITYDSNSGIITIVDPGREAKEKEKAAQT